MIQTKLTISDRRCMKRKNNFLDKIHIRPLACKTSEIGFVPGRDTDYISENLSMRRTVKEFF